MSLQTGATYQYKENGRTNTLTILGLRTTPNISYYETYDHEAGAPKFMSAAIMEQLVTKLYKLRSIMMQPAKVIPFNIAHN